jgi:hypothetical protein
MDLRRGRRAFRSSLRESVKDNPCVNSHETKEYKEQAIWENYLDAYQNGHEIPIRELYAQLSKVNPGKYSPEYLDEEDEEEGDLGMAFYSAEIIREYGQEGKNDVWCMGEEEFLFDDYNESFWETVLDEDDRANTLWLYDFTVDLTNLRKSLAAERRAEKEERAAERGSARESYRSRSRYSRM